jgi:hypothetical protein
LHTPKSKASDDELTDEEAEALAELMLLEMENNDYETVAGVENMDTINIDGHSFTGTWYDFSNGTGYYFKLKNGEYLKGYFQQGRYGKKEYLLMCQFDKYKRMRRYFNNSDRQVKDPYAYFLHF